MPQETHPRQGMHICSRGRSREGSKSPLGDSFDSMYDSGSSAVVLEVAKIIKKGNYISDGTNQGFCIFFYLGVPARRRELCHIRTRHKMPPRRRAFRSNNFGLRPTTIPRDAKRQAEPPSRQGTHSHQNHFRFNPSRGLDEPFIRFAASNLQLRLNVLPRRDFPAHAPLPGVAALVPHTLTPGYQALAPAGAAQGKTLSIILPSFRP